MDKDTIVKAKLFDLNMFGLWTKIILALFAIGGAVMFYVLRALWEDTVLLIVALWGFLIAIVFIALILRAVGKAKDRRAGKPVATEEGDAWRLPDDGGK